MPSTKQHKVHSYDVFAAAFLNYMSAWVKPALQSDALMFRKRLLLCQGLAVPAAGYFSAD